MDAYHGGGFFRDRRYEWCHERLQGQSELFYIACILSFLPKHTILGVTLARP